MSASLCYCNFTDVKFHCENTQTAQTLQETEGNYTSTLHKKNTVQSHGCNEYINNRKDVQIKLYKMGPNWRTSFVCCVVSPVPLRYSYLLSRFVYVSFSSVYFNWFLADVRSCTNKRNNKNHNNKSER